MDISELRKHKQFIVFGSIDMSFNRCLTSFVHFTSPFTLLEIHLMRLTFKYDKVMHILHCKHYEKYWSGHANPRLASVWPQHTWWTFEMIMLIINSTQTVRANLDYGPDSKVHGDNMGPIWGRQDPGGPLVGLMNFAIWGTRRARPLVYADFASNPPKCHHYIVLDLMLLFAEEEILSSKPLAENPRPLPTMLYTADVKSFLLYFKFHLLDNIETVFTSEITHFSFISLVWHR